MTPVFLPGESHGQRSLAGYSPSGRKESDTTERPTHTHTQDGYIILCICEDSYLQIEKQCIKKLFNYLRGPAYISGIHIYISGIQTMVKNPAMIQM